jgi:hypothetical protein
MNKIPENILGDAVKDEQEKGRKGIGVQIIQAMCIY